MADWKVEIMIIVLEGLDNCGKTTISDMLASYYKGKGLRVYVSKELTTEVGQLIKGRNRDGELSPVTKTFLFAADRQIRMESIDFDFYNLIIMDRYIHSAIAYREADGLNGEWIRNVNKHNRKSDINFYIDITPEESVKRNTEEKFNFKYTLAKVRDSYRRAVDKGELIEIDGMPGINSVLGKIKMVIDERIGNCGK